MKIAYADPPYEGCAHLYKDHPDYGGEVDHAALIARLVADYPDGWALSMKTNSLRSLLPLCPFDARVGAWVKPFAAYKANVKVAYAWEPIVWRGGRGLPSANGRDWCSAPMTMKRGLTGVKPKSVCFWLFRVLGLQPGDTFDDLFPGSGAVMRAWDSYCAAPLTLPLALGD